MSQNIINAAAAAIAAGRSAARLQRLLLVALIAALVGVAAAKAEQPTPRQACKGDVQTLCAGVFPGGGRIKQCMIEKRDQLSEACKTALLAARAKAGK
jgi:hypothetical protein